MTLRTLLSVFVVLCITKNTFADTDDEKCTKMEGRTDSQITTLRKKLLCSYDKQTAPVDDTCHEDRVCIKIYLEGFRIKYTGSPEWGNIDVYTMLENSVNWFTMSTYVLMSWKDERLKWNKSEHNNHTRIHFERSEIWAPEIEASGGNSAIFGQDDGTINAFCWIHLIGNCRPISFYWGDQRECVLSFRVDPGDKVQIHRPTDTSLDTDYHVSNSATWSVVEAKRIFPQKEEEIVQGNDEFVKINKQMPWKYGPGYFETKVTIQRNFAIQDAVIFAPAAVLLILLVSSTCIPANEETRVAMLSLIIILQVFMFHQACRAMPFLPGKVVNIVALYHDIIICSGAAFVEWLIAYIIANAREPPTGNTSDSSLPRPSIFPALKNIFVISEKDSRGINTSQLLDRITFLLLAIISFILLVVQGRRPPSLPIEGTLNV